MMQDGKCICGWCGSKLHVTGDSTCPNLVESKKKKASKAKKLAKKKFHRRLPEITARIQAMRIGLGFALTISHDETTDTVKAAKTLISEWQKSRKSVEPQAGKILHKRPIGNHPVSRKVAVQDLKQLNKASDILYEYEQNVVHNVGAANTEEESHLVRKAAFTQEVEDQYRIKLMKKVRVSEYVLSIFRIEMIN
jgi:hypothetical protein